MGMTTANDSAILMVSGAIIANTGDANYSNPVSIGSGAYVTQNDGIAIGRSAVGGGIAIGSTANASNTNGISIGKSSDCTASESVAVGFGAQATSTKTTVIGYNANVTNTHTVAIGYNVTAASYCVAIGANNTQATTTSAVAIGANTEANGNGAIAIGADAESNGDQTTTVGQGAGRNSSTSVYAIRIGKDANAGDSAIAIGWKTNVADSGFVVGNSSSNSILSGQFNSSTSHTDGFLNVLANKLQVSGDGSVKVNNQYTFPTGVTASNDYVLTAQTDGTTAWAAAAGGGTPGGSDTQVQFNGGGNFEGDSALVWNSGTNVLTISGHLAATTKSFLIDHPTEPEKQLQYASLEGPENGVYVRGHTNDSIIDLPDYWTALVDQGSITVQVTAKDFAQPNLFVSGVLNNKVYLISEGAVSACYNVSATRKDVAPLEVEI